MPQEFAEGTGFEPSGRRRLRGVWRLLRGPGDQRPSYWLTRFWFLRGLGLVYLVAFTAAVFQLVPLVGSGGLLPVGQYLGGVAAASDGAWDAFSTLPTLFWIDHSDTALLTVSIVGAVLAAALLLGISHPLQLLALWFLYMSIDHVGQRWYSFGWESQLLETGFLAVFVGSWRSWRPFPVGSPMPTVLVVLLRWLIVRIMLGAGLIKLRGDPCWSDLSCLAYHFETQPIPNPVSWFAHQLPAVALKGGVAVNHLVELVAPCFAFGPRRARHVAGASMIAFQVVLIASGNLAFLNWLTILPCIACFDDRLLGRITPRRWQPALTVEQREAVPTRAHRIVAYALAGLVAYLSLPVVGNLLSGKRQAMNRSYDRLHLVNTYGAFGSVGRERFELVIEGTVDDDVERARWKEYGFLCKPGDPMRRPCVITPYHRRLDWLIWFAALEAEHTGRLRREDWVFHLLYKLLQGDEGILSLMGPNPFPDRPPRYVRVLFYRYAFTAVGDDAPGWWKRELVGELIRPVSADDEAFREYLGARGWLTEPVAVQGAGFGARD